MSGKFREGWRILFTALPGSLISLAMEKNPRVVPELVSMYDPKDLPALADEGIIPAAEKLVESDPEKYFERYEEILPLPAKKRAVDKLIEQDLPVYGKKYADKYWSLLSESNMKKVMNAGLFSKESLVQIAMGGSWLAKKAADLLPKSSLAKVRESKNSDVALIGKAHYYADLVRSADEKELLEIMDWALQNESDPKLYLKALHRLKSQESLLKVLNDYFFSPKQQKSNWQFRSWEPVWTEILNCITDGPGLAAFCLEQSELLPCESFIRLKKLIRGTDAEEQFIQGIVQNLMSHDHWWFWTRLLRDYYDSPRAAGAAWRFGGPELIQRILDLLEREYEVDRAKDLGSVLQFIYKNVPESHSVLNGQNGRRYEKHLICIDSWCAGRSRTIDVDYMLDLD